MSMEEKKELLAEVLDVDIEDLMPETRLVEMEEWDSMAKLGIIVMFEDECGIKITRKEVMNFETIGDILDCMN